MTTRIVARQADYFRRTVRENSAGVGPSHSVLRSPRDTSAPRESSRIPSFQALFRTLSPYQSRTTIQRAAKNPSSRRTSIAGGYRLQKYRARVPAIGAWRPLGASSSSRDERTLVRSARVSGRVRKYATRNDSVSCCTHQM